MQSGHVVTLQFTFTKFNANIQWMGKRVYVNHTEPAAMTRELFFLSTNVVTASDVEW